MEKHSKFKIGDRIRLTQKARKELHQKHNHNVSRIIQIEIRNGGSLPLITLDTTIISHQIDEGWIEKVKCNLSFKTLIVN